MRAATVSRRVRSLGFRVEGFGFRVRGLVGTGFEVLVSAGFGVRGLGVEVYHAGSRASPVKGVTLNPKPQAPNPKQISIAFGHRHCGLRP